jgi:peptidoglycan-associated lipoprotein
MQPEPTPPPPPPEPESFDKADLDAELQRQIAENLQTIYFVFDSYTLSTEAKDKLRAAANFLQQHATLRVVLEGNCDERGSAEYNMGLGFNRANAVKSYLSNLGVSGSMLETTSWGKERPVTYNCGEDDTCHGKNRRVEYKVIK